MAFTGIDKANRFGSKGIVLKNGDPSSFAEGLTDQIGWQMHNMITPGLLLLQNYRDLSAGSLIDKSALRRSKPPATPFFRAQQKEGVMLV